MVCSPDSGTPSYHQFPAVRDGAGQCAGGHGQRAGEEDLGLLVPHATGEVAVGCADARDGRVEAAEGVAWPAQTRGAAGIADLRASRQEDIAERLPPDLL